MSHKINGCSHFNNTYKTSNAFFNKFQGVSEGVPLTFLRQAFALAGKAINPSPNPYVGAVIVKNNSVVGKGYHLCAGMPHAEIIALRKAGKKARAATLYLNLEPCVHYGRTPPCAPQIVKAGIKKVVVSMIDPNPLVNGQGIGFLRKARIEVKLGLLEKEARILNQIYLKYMTRGLPFVALKAGMSLDGKIATESGDSQWITSLPARRYAHKLRNKFDGILVGINTVLRDDPGLDPVPCWTGKTSDARRPYKIVVDSKARIPLRSKIFQKASSVILAIGERATRGRQSAKKIKALKKMGAKVLIIKEKNDQVDLKTLMRSLAKEEICSVLIEGGGEVNASALKLGIVDKVLFFIAPKIIGGRKAITAVEGEGIKKINKAINLKAWQMRKIGPDLLLEGYIKYN